MEQGSAVPYLRPPSVIKRAPWEDSEERRVSNWITAWDFCEPIDAGLIGAPYSGASISASGAAGGPEAVRLAFRYNTTYSPDWDTDIQRLRVRDLGDIAGHLTSVETAHYRIEEAVKGALTVAEPFVPIIIGGDHSITAPAVRGFCAANPGKKIGIINFDAHFDVRNFEHGPHNGTPFRQIIEGNLGIEGQNVVEIGIHGFMNASRYYRWALDHGMTIITARRVEQIGMEACINDALTMALVFAPDLVTTQALYVDVELGDGPGHAGTYADFWKLTGKPPNMHVALEVDVERFMHLFVERMAGLAARTMM